ncbi:ACT domain-containing protein, partial [Streptomyces sp. NPDC004752]
AALGPRPRTAVSDPVAPAATARTTADGGAGGAGGAAPVVRAPGVRSGDRRARSGGGPRRAGADLLVERPGAVVRLAGCCTPVPPDEITGFSVRGGVVTVHRVRCAAVTRMKNGGRAEVGVRWGDSAACRVTLVAESFGRPHLLADLTEAIALEGAEVVSATVEPPSQQRVRHTYTLQLPDAARLPALMRAMRNVPGVYDVTRAQHELSGS